MQRQVRERTASAIEERADAETPTLIEAPPASGKTWNAIRLAADDGRNITYLSGRTDLYDQAEDIAAELPDVRIARIPSPYRDCPTFRGDNDGDQQTAQRLYQKGLTGRTIHFLGWDTVATPCQDPSTDSRCPYIDQLERLDSQTGDQEIDLLIGNHQHAYRESYIKDRTVVLDEFNPDPFITRYLSGGTSDRIGENPSSTIAKTLEQIDELPFDDITDLIEARDDDSPARLDAVEWFEESGADPGTARELISIPSQPYNTTDTLGLFLVYSLLFMSKVGPGFELAYEPARWRRVGMPAGTRVVRDRNSGEILILRPPALDTATQVIGLDALPTKRLWDVVYDCEFSHQRILPRVELGTYLTASLDFELIQLGDGMNHYSGGNISSRDPQRFRAARILAGEPFALITRKQALEQYRRQPWFEFCIEQPSEGETIDTDVGGFCAKHYATIRSSNAFEDRSIGFVSGSPYPGDAVIKRWAALCDEPTIPERATDGQLQDFTGFGSRVYRHFTHHQVVQAVYRFGRDSRQTDAATTVYINTLALPEWLPITTQITIRDRQSDPLRTLIVEELIQATRDPDRLDEQTAGTLQSAITETIEQSDGPVAATVSGITERYVRDTLRSEELQNVITVTPDAGKHGADLYSWAGDEHLKSRSLESTGTHILLLDSVIYSLRLNS